MRGKQSFKVILMFLPLTILLALLGMALVFYIYQSTYLSRFLEKNRETLSPVLENPKKYELQILYTRVYRLPNETPLFFRSSYRVDAKQYFYPASAVKLPVAALALEKLKGLSKGQFSTDALLQLSEDKKLRLPAVQAQFKRLITQSIVNSDNQSYNLLYEFLGQQSIYDSLQRKGYHATFIQSRLGVSIPMNYQGFTRKLTVSEAFMPVYEQPAKEAPPTNILSKIELSGLRKGVNQTLNFHHLNYASISDLQGILRAILFPNDTSAKQRFNLRAVDRELLLKAMSGEGSTAFKFLFYGAEGSPIPELQIYNKIGQAYGYLIDNAYFINKKDGVEFMVTVVLYCNEDNRFEGGSYEYEEVGLPFLKKLGRLLYEELL